MNSTIGLVGVKLGMTRVFKEAGASIPVTVIHAQPNRVCQIKLKKKDGYDAVQLAAGEQKPQRLSKALRGHYAKARVATGRSLVELRITTEQAQAISSITQLDVSQFVEGQKVDLIGKSKGRGFSGAIKRWNFSSQDASHGNSISHRHLGSTGQCQFPGKVWKGKKMAGQYGNKRSTIMRLEVVAIDEEKDLLLVKGAVPGPEGRQVIIRPSHKETPVERERVEELRQVKAQQKEAEEKAADQQEIQQEIQQETQQEEAKSREEENKEPKENESKESKGNIEETIEEEKKDTQDTEEAAETRETRDTKDTKESKGDEAKDETKDETKDGVKDGTKDGTGAEKDSIGGAESKGDQDSQKEEDKAGHI